MGLFSKLFSKSNEIEDLIKQAESLISEKKYQQAYGVYYQALNKTKKKKDKISIYYAMIDIKQTLRDYSSLQDLFSILEQQDNSTDLQLKKARFFVSFNKPEQAKTIYQTILKKEPENESALIALAHVYENENEFDKAAEIYEKITAFSDNTEALIKTAKVRFGNLRYSDARELSKKAVEIESRKSLNSQDKNVFYFAATAHAIYNEIEHKDTAVEFLNKAIEVDKNFFSARKLRVDTLLKKMQIEPLDDSDFSLLAYDMYLIAKHLPEKENIAKALEYVSSLGWNNLRKELIDLLFKTQEKTEKVYYTAPKNKLSEEDLENLKFIDNLRMLLLSNDFTSVSKQAEDLISRRLIFNPSNSVALYFKEVLLLSKGEYLEAEKEAGDVLFRLGEDYLKNDSDAFWDRVAEFLLEKNNQFGSNEYSKNDLEAILLDSENIGKLFRFVDKKEPCFLANFNLKLK